MDAALAEIRHAQELDPLSLIINADIGELLWVARRYEDAARLRDRIEALEHVVERLCRLDRLRELEACLVVPGPREGWRKAFFVSRGALRAVRRC